MNKFGVFSYLMVIASIIIFLILRGPNADILMVAIILGALSLFGIIFAILSNNWLSRILGVLLNGIVLVCAFLLALAWAIAG